MARTGTKERVLGEALISFGTSGYDSTSLDAIANVLGVRKQTILYHFSSKQELLVAVVDRAGSDLRNAIEDALDGAGHGFERVEALVRRMFRLALERPELLGLLREVSRPGSSTAGRLSIQMEPLIDRGRVFLEREMKA
ncbi:MAG: TetR/AcrR family transcriptional regulator, partial [Acidimicrobiales bacterium]